MLWIWMLVGALLVGIVVLGLASWMALEGARALEEEIRRKNPPC